MSQCDCARRGMLASAWLLLVINACHAQSPAHERKSKPPEPASSNGVQTTKRPVPATKSRTAPANTSPTAQASGGPRAAPAGDWSTPQHAMDQFIAALRRKDTDLLLRSFSKRRRFALTSTSNDTPDKSRYSYATLVRGMKPGGDFRGVMFGDDGLDSIYYYATAGNQHGPWPLLPSGLFVPKLYLPTGNESPMVWVRWAKEGSRYVIDAIAFPF